MPTSYKEMLAAAHAAVPKVTAAEAASLVKDAGALIVDVRDGTEEGASGKAKGAVAVPRGSLESRRRPVRRTTTRRSARTIRSSCTVRRRTRRTRRQNAARPGVHQCANLGGFKDWVAGGGKIEPA